MYILVDIFTKTNWDIIIDRLIGDSNIISLLDAILAIIVVIVTVIAGGIKIIKFLITGITKRKLKKNWYKELEFPINKKTKKSFNCYIPTRGQDIDPCNSEEMIDNRPCFSQELIPFFMQNDFEKNRNRYYIVLADSGMGKTTFLFNLFFSYYKKLRRKHDIKFIPLSINSVFEEIEKIEDKQNTILLLDALDENREAINNYKKYMEKLVDETIKFHTIIITCRTQFFSNETDEPKYIEAFSVSTDEKEVMFEKVYISPFNQQEIDIYLKKKYNRIFERKKIKYAKKVIANCPKLMVRPMLLAYIDDLITDQTKEYDYVYEIYCELVSKWIERETNIQDKRKQLYRFSEKVAEHMYFKKLAYISVDEIENLCTEYDIKIKAIEAKSRSLLNRNINGNYKFAHKSILEYFLANKAIEDTQFRKVIVSHGFIEYDMIELFLEEMSVSYVKKLIISGKLENGFFEFLKLSKIDLSNMQIINCCFERCNLSKADFRKVVFDNTNLKGTNLFNADLSSANLSGANLSGANLSGANLSGANLSGADLSGADINRASLERASLSQAKFDENQIDYLQEKYDLTDTMVFVKKTRNVVSYQEYKSRIRKKFIVEDEDFEYAFLNMGNIGL